MKYVVSYKLEGRDFQSFEIDWTDNDYADYTKGDSGKQLEVFDAMIDHLEIVESFGVEAQEENKQWMLPISPTYTEKIYCNEKFYELRRIIPIELTSGDEVLIYETNTGGKVTGSFQVGNIISKKSFSGLVEALPGDFYEMTGVGISEAQAYFEGAKTFNAIQIENVIQFDDKRMVEDFDIKYPLQSWARVKKRLSTWIR